MSGTDDHDIHKGVPGDPNLAGGESINVRDEKGNYVYAATDKNGDIKVLKSGTESGGKYDHMNDEWEREEPSGGCYITTVVLETKQQNTSQLQYLKNWRYGVLEKNKAGYWLSNYYRKTATNTAQRLRDKPKVLTALLFIIVKPALYLAKNRPNSTVGKAITDLLLLMFFLTGLSAAEILKRG